MKNEIMEKIKKENIRMHPASLFVAQKLGLQSILALMILASALLLNIFLYFLKKTGILKFMSFGWPGLKIILLTLPYDYIALFIITIVLANYIMHKFDLSRGIRMNSNVAVLFLLAITLLLGSFFAVNGMESAIQGWSKNTLPGDKAISGRVVDFSDTQVVIKDSEGVTRILSFDSIKDSADSPVVRKYEKNKFLRAIGKRDHEDVFQFHAEEVECCDEN